MLFIKHFATFIFTSLVFGSMVLAMPAKGAKPDSIEKGKIYQGKVNHTEPKAGTSVCSLSHSGKRGLKNPGLQDAGRHPMVILGDPDSVTGHAHVGILTHTEDPNGGTKPESEYGLPGDGHAQQSYHTIHKDKLEHLGDAHPQAKKDHQMSDEHLKNFEADTKANKH